ncbi:hypothetical protein B9P78_00590 [Aerococcus sp. 1KP-2016]|nr:hypothetical protein B9P78_00590 [Aerococcus sp. 1KP-2016]
MDTSGSMNTRIGTAQSASKQFINTLLGNQNEYGNRVAFIPFSHGSMAGGNDSLEVASATAGSHNFTDNATTLNSYVDSTFALGGTNYSAALQKAISFRDSRSSSEQSRPLYVVFMSDGAPGSNGQAISDPNWNGSAQATALKNAGAIIYTLGIQVSGTAPQALTNISSSVNGQPLYNSVTNLNDISKVLQEIAGKIHLAGTNASFTDYISDNYEFYSAGSYISDGTYNSTNRSVNIPIVGDITQETKQYKIYVQLKDDLWLTDQTYDTNIDIHLDYDDVNKVSQQLQKDEIGNPSLSVTYGTIGIKYVLVDKDGNYINQNGEVVDYQNRVFVGSQDPMLYHMVNGTNHLEVYGDPVYQVPADPPENYALYSGENDPKAVTLTNDQKNQIVEFKVMIPEPDPIDFIFTKVDEEGRDLVGASFTLEKL